MNPPRFKIGQRFNTSGKYPRQCTVVDILRTYNSAGALVSVRYVAEHEFLGQKILDNNVLETTIAKGLVEA